MEKNKNVAAVVDPLAAMIRDEEYHRAEMNGAPNQPGAFITLPLFTWAPPGMNVGRKGHLMLPVRIDWEASSLILTHPGDRVHLVGQACGAGYAGRVGATITTDDTLARVCITQTDPGPVFLPAPLLRQQSVLEAGILADVWRTAAQTNRTRWITWRVDDLYRCSHHELGQAVGRLSKNISFFLGTRVQVGDDITLESLNYSFNEPGGPMDRLLGKMRDPQAFRKVDPAYRLRVNMARAAGEHVQDWLGDPHNGRQLRVTSAELDCTDPVIVGAVNRQMTGVGTSVARTRAALDYATSLLKPARELKFR